PRASRGAGRKNGGSLSPPDGGTAWRRAAHTHARSPLGTLTGSSRPAGAGGKPAPIADDRPLTTHFTKNGGDVRSAYRAAACLSTKSTAQRLSITLQKLLGRLLLYTGLVLALGIVVISACTDPQAQPSPAPTRASPTISRSL